MIENQDHKRALCAAAERLKSGDGAGATADLKQFVNTRLDLEGRPDDLTAYIFAAALTKAAAGRGVDEAHIYLRDYDVPQIHLFDLLATRVPFVSLAGPVANHILFEKMKGRDEVVLLDVGCGTGRQAAALIDKLAAEGAWPRRFTVVGIEPSLETLKLAESTILERARALKVELYFHGIHGLAENLTDEDWAAIRRFRGDLFVSEAFAVHHIAGHTEEETSRLRDQVLSRIRSLDPVAFVLAEPNSDHNEPDFFRRLTNCFHHFSVGFRVIDQLGISQRDKNALKVCFFGREIEDIVGNSDANRRERHESTASWVRRLTAAGFRVETGFPFLSEYKPPVIEVKEYRDHVGFDYEGESIVSVLCAVPTERVTSAHTASFRLELGGFDAELYLRVLITIAKADQIIHRSERDFIEAQAQILKVDDRAMWDESPVDLEKLRHINASPRTREAIVRDCLLLATLDGEYQEQERALIGRIAEAFSLTPQELAELEALARGMTPPLADKTPGWLKELWAISSKGNLDL
jgi:SAM-dependent methyltransferase